MMTIYPEDNLLPLSGIQHFAFCRRQWALIHIERQWAENLRTIEGRHIHERADNPFLTETRSGLLISRSVPVVSYRLGLFGVADVVEFYRTDDTGKGLKLKDRDGLWLPNPVEYKRGNKKADGRDEVQLCAQAMCLEEMLSVKINSGDLFYGLTRHRVKVEFSEVLRKHVEELSEQMHGLFEKGNTPPAEPGKRCKLCSLVEICMPELTQKNWSVKEYIEKQIQETNN